MHSQVVFYIPTRRREDTVLAFERVAGVPLYLRGILTMASCGYTQFTLITPAQYRRHILKNWQKVVLRRPELQLHLISIENHRWTEQNYADLARVTAPHFLWLSSNILFTQNWLNAHITPLLQRQRTVVASAQYPAAWAVLQAKDFQNLSTWAPGTNENLLDHLIPILVAQGLQAQSYTSGRDDCFPLDHRADIGRGEDFLCEYIRLSATGWTARTINKRISLPISKILTKLRITPNSITVFNMLIGLASGIGTGGFTNTSLLIGAILFQTASVIDGCDGEVAKLTFRMSKFGQFIDTISDNSALLSFFIGLIIHEYRVSGDWTSLGWGAFLMLGMAALLGNMIHYLKHHSDSASLVAFEKQFIGGLKKEDHPFIVKFLQSAKFIVKKDCFSMIFLIMAIFNILPYALFFTTIAVWTGATLITYLRIEPYLKRRTNLAEEGHPRD